MGKAYDTYEGCKVCADCGEKATRKMDGRWLCDECYLDTLASFDDEEEPEED